MMRGGVVRGESACDDGAVDGWVAESADRLWGECCGHDDSTEHRNVVSFSE
jgi:hypothetical protein